MRRLNRVLLIAFLAVLALALAAGCGASRRALLPGEPRVEVRLPPAEAVDIRLHEERAPAAAQRQPQSVADEAQGRWLTLFEMNVVPSEAAGVPSAERR